MSKWVTALFRLGLCLLAYFLILEIVRVTVGPNWHVIVPLELYRSAQLSEPELQTVVNRFGITGSFNSIFKNFGLMPFLHQLIQLSFI